MNKTMEILGKAGFLMTYSEILRDRMTIYIYQKGSRELVATQKSGSDTLCVYALISSDNGKEHELDDLLSYLSGDLLDEEPKPEDAPPQKQDGLLG